jgi:hypothetical protein
MAKNPAPRFRVSAPDARTKSEWSACCLLAGFYLFWNQAVAVARDVSKE